MHPFAIVLNGTSSAGKTTLAQTLQQRAGEPVLHAALDTFTDMYAWSAITDEETRRICHRTGVDNFHQTLRLLAAGPHAIVVDHVFEQRAWADATLAALTTRRVFMIGVRCPLATLQAREQSRPDRRPGMAAWQFDRVHEGTTYDFEIDTSIETPESAADKILAFVHQSLNHP
ncbi:MAG: hypothetical protein R3F03_01360 [Opitutaceae bacterium]